MLTRFRTAYEITDEIITETREKQDKIEEEFEQIE